MSLWGRIGAAVEAFRAYGNPEPVIEVDNRYQNLWAFYAGTWRTDPAVRRQRRGDPRIYQRTRLVWNLARAVTRLYAQSVYQGDLTTDGRPLPDGSGGALPIDPQTGDQANDDAIRRGCAELWSLWLWRQQMSLGPKYAAVLGDCLIELVDDLGRGVVLPKHVWPGYVVDIGLDLVGNVKRYAVEYDVVVEQSTAYGMATKDERYRFRKEVDGTAFRYYRDDRPAAFPELGIRSAVEPNPYGFVPAVWLRHEVVPGDRGLGAFEAAVQTEREINGVLSQALDYQIRQFAAPLGVKGAALGARGGTIAVPKPATGDSLADADKAAETINLLPMTADGEFVVVNFDVGRTVEMVAKLEEALVAEFPEARFGQQILEMTQVTAPGVERALGPIVGMVQAARANHDPQVIKLHQMALAIMGQRLADDDYPADVVAARPARYAAFRPFDLGSYGRGDLDFGISSRPVITETEDERLDRLVKISVIAETGDPWLMERAGIPAQEVARMARDRAERRAAMDAALTGVGEGEGE